MKIVPIIQARMSARRLPDKVLMDIAGKPMLQHVIDRVRRADIGDVVVATSDDASDDRIALFCEKQGVPCFRGSLNDLIGRYYSAAQQYNADVVVRLTGDCPLLDPSVIRSVVDLYSTGNYDYVSNVNPPTFPDGLDTEVFSFEGLENAYKNATLPSDREHIAPYFEKRPKEFRLGNVEHTQDLSMHRWTVDEQNDVTFVCSVFEHLGTDVFSMNEIIALVEKYPHLRDVNQSIVRNAGHASALEADEAFLSGQ